MHDGSRFTERSDSKCFNVQDTCVWMDGKCFQKLMILDGSHTGWGTASPHPMVWCFGPTGGHGETDLISDGGADD